MVVLMLQVLQTFQNTGQNCDDFDGIYQYRLADSEFFEYEFQEILRIKG